MRSLLYAVFTLAVASASLGASFTPRAPDEAYGLRTSAWRFASSLSKDSRGSIDLCYSEEGGVERILGSVDVRPFRSSEEMMPDLRILFSKVEVDGKKMVMVLVSYGLRSGAFVTEIPALTAHSLCVSGMPTESAEGEVTLLGYGAGPETVKPDGSMVGLRGRLFFRYVNRG